MIQKGAPFGFFRYCETLFFFNLTEQLFYSQYGIENKTAVRLS